MTLDGTSSRDGDPYALTLDAPLCRPKGESIAVVDRDASCATVEFGVRRVRRVRVDGRVAVSDAGARPAVGAASRAAGL